MHRAILKQAPPGLHIVVRPLRTSKVSKRAALCVILVTVFVVASGFRATADDAGFRIWRDNTGQSSFKAQFIAVRNGAAELRLKNGNRVLVQLTKLSAEDQSLVRQLATPNPKAQVDGSTPETPQSVKRAGLLNSSDLQYLGAFRVPLGDIGASSFAYGGTACAFNPANRSLFIVGHDHHQAVAEIEIPRIVHSDKIADLATAKALQPFARVLPRIPHFTLEGNVKIGGLLVVDGQLIGTAYEYYDADGNARESHFRLSSLDLKSADIEGLFQVGRQGGGFVGGYMTAVPGAWAERLGAPFLTGQAALSIVSRTSAGPCALGFDPKQLGARVANVRPFVWYPLAFPLRDETSTNLVYNLTSDISGAYFDEGSGSVLFFGSHGTGEYCYGTPEECGDPVRGGKGTHSRGGRYRYQVWAYDAFDFVAVSNGRRKPWELEPYAVWPLEFPFAEKNAMIGGVAHDPNTGRIFVSQLYGDVIGYDLNPIIHVFTIRPAKTTHP